MKEYLEIEITDGLFVSGEKGRVVFRIDREMYPDQFKIERTYNDVGYRHIAGQLKEVILNVWPELEPREATSLSSDYAEYYDKELDSNGYMGLHGNKFYVDAPNKDHERAFILNKRKAQDLLSTINKVEEYYNEKTNRLK